jgi:hypothetical protein
MGLDFEFLAQLDSQAVAQKHPMVRLFSAVKS